MNTSSPIAVPQHRSAWALPLSLLAHGGLLAALVLSVAWKSEPPPALQAELWAALPSTAAASPVSVASVEPQSQAEAKPQPQAATKPVADAAPAPDAIAAQVIKKPLKKPEPESKVEPKPTPKAVPKVEPKPEAKFAPTPKTPAKVEAKPEPKPAKTEINAAKETAKEAARAKEIARMNQLSQNVNLGGAPTIGTPQAGTVGGLGQGWGAKLKACVQPNLRYSDASGGNPRVELLVKLSPTGSPLDAVVSKPSGSEAYDTAVQRAVRRCDPFPKPESGAYLSQLTVAYRLND